MMPHFLIAQMQAKHTSFKHIMINSRLVEKMNPSGERNPMVMTRIVGEILDPFTPTVGLRVSIGGKSLFNGGNLKPSQLAESPKVEICGDDFQKFYTLLLVDADSPSPSNPHLREYLHWLVTDIPGTTGAAIGKEVLSYEKPQLGAGIHRLVLVLFQQPGFDTVTFFGKRTNFKTRDYAGIYGLGSPVAAMFFHGQGEKGCGGRRF